MLTVTDKRTGIEVTVHMERFDGTHYHYRYVFTHAFDNHVLTSGDDLRIPSMGGNVHGMDVAAMQALADFLGAYIDAQMYGDHREADLFDFPDITACQPSILEDLRQEIYFSVGYK